MFEGLELRPEDLADPYLSVPLTTVVALMERARSLAREPALGFYLGFQMSLSAHGYLGFAAMSAPTLREALALAVEFAPIRTTAVQMHLEVRGAWAALVIDEDAELGSAQDIILLGLLVGLWQMGNAVLGHQITTSTVHVTFSEPAYYARFRNLAPRVFFAQPASLLRFDAALLDARLTSADPASLRLAREQCERLLDSVRSEAGFVDRARRLLLWSDAGVRSFDELARAVRLSPRTLRRRLAKEGVSFAALREEARRDRAIALLRSSERSTKEVAERLGYANVANFIRAFRRWTGRTPGSYRSPPCGGAAVPD